MSIFSTIKDAIFGKANAESLPQVPAEAAKGQAVGSSSGQATAPAATTTTPVASPAATGSSPVDVAAVLDDAVRANGQSLDWKRSIVDLLKALDIDSSLAARKELAAELGYTGDTSDSATMNIWLHKAVIKRLSENGGKVPADLLD